MESADILRRFFKDRDKLRFDGIPRLFDLIRGDLHLCQLCFVKARGIFQECLIAVLAHVRDDVRNDIFHR